MKSFRKKKQENNEHGLMMKHLLKKKVNPMDCPNLKDCKEKVLETEFELLCKDKETSREIILVHMAGKHAYELCSQYLKKLKEEQGKYPAQWNASKQANSSS